MIGIEKEKLKSYLEAGMTNVEISEIEHFEPNSIANMIRNYGLTYLRQRGPTNKPEKKPQKKKIIQKPTGPNADRHLCRKCKYQAARHEVNNCDYIWFTGHKRGCLASNCDKYEKGKRLIKR